MGRGGSEKKEEEKVGMEEERGAEVDLRYR